MRDDLLNTTEAALYTRLAPQTLAVRRLKGTGPVFLKVGSRVYYRRADLDSWLDGCARTSTSDRGGAR
ncbi:MAG TPA: helix-turn-helix domain-containing protein [Candidatus Defluviicoccus seviourii]|nr:helix-turn-helix domain-containing protein [Candidatus Defluviicoccus seviourii]